MAGFFCAAIMATVLMAVQIPFLCLRRLAEIGNSCMRIYRTRDVLRLNPVCLAPAELARACDARANNQI